MTRTPKYRRQSGRNFAFVEHQGKRIRLPGDYGSPESRRAYARILAEVAEHDLPARIERVSLSAGKLSVSRLCTLFLPYAKLRYKESGGEYGHYAAAITKLQQAGATNLAVDGFGPRKLKAVRQLMIENGWTRQYANAQTRRIRRIFAWGVSEEIVAPNVLVALKTVGALRLGEGEESRAILPVDVTTVESTLPYLTPVLAAMVRLQLFTGMRPQSVCGLTPAEIDRSDDIWVYRPQRHKNAWRGQGLRIFLGPQAQAVLAPYLNRAHEAYCFSPRESEAWRYKQLRLQRKTPVQPSQRGKRKRRMRRVLRDHYDTRSYCHAIKGAIRRLNNDAEKSGKPQVVDWHPNQIRHTVATAIRKQYGVETARIILGHATASSTAIYAEADFNLAVAVAREIG